LALRPLPEVNVSIARQEEILGQLLSYYVSLRCPHNLVYGRIHRDKSHVHAHLIISSNPVAKNQRLSLRRSDFETIKTKLDDFRIANFRELGIERYMGDQAKAKKRQRLKNQPKTTDREYAFSKRTGQPSRKERDHQILHEIFEDRSINSEVMLDQRLKATGFQLYKRGSTEGVQCLDRPTRYRLKTLGVELGMQRTKDRILVFAERQQEISRDHSSVPSQELSRDRS